MQVPFLDLKKINLKDYSEISQAIDDVINGGWYIQGSHCKQFEQNFANYGEHEIHDVYLP